MKLNELTPSEVKAGLKQKKMKVPFKGQTKVDTSDSDLWLNFKKWDAFLRKNGWKKLGNGSFAAVFGKPGLSYVIKVPFYRDRPWMKYAEYCMTHRNNPHVMKVSFLKEETSTHFFIAAIERLKNFPNYGGMSMADYAVDYIEQLSNGHKPKEIMQRIEKRAKEMLGHTGTMNKQESNWLLKVLMPQIPALAKVVMDLKNIDHLDLHQGNIMMRGKTIVIIDPWFSWGEKKPRSYSSSLYS